MTLQFRIGFDNLKRNNIWNYIFKYTLIEKN